jgi:two-component system, NtrC family, sensor kinase
MNLKPIFPLLFTLRAKFILCIGIIVSLSYALLLYKTSQIQDDIIIAQTREQAKMLFRQILLTRQWVADHNGIFVLKKEGVEANPFLHLPEISDNVGNLYVMRNPAMITRELSRYSEQEGYSRFRVTSLHPVNTANAADAYEQEAMLSFKQGAREASAVFDSENGRVVRFVAPLNVEYACLECHAQQGYQFGDVIGALSITIPIAWVDSMLADSKKNLLFVGFVSVFLVTIGLFLLLDTLVTGRISKLSAAMKSFPEQMPDPRLLPAGHDEIAALSDHFSHLCQRLHQSRTELEKNRSQACFNEKMASLGILSAGIAHEVNNPLAGMLNCVKAMGDNPENRELHQRYLPLINKGLKQIEQTMRQLLNFGRTEPLQQRKVDAEALIRECFELLSFKLQNIELRLQLDFHHDILVDAEALKQIIVNIGLNGIQAMKEKSGIFTVRGSCQGGQLRLIFEDTGTGISSEDLPRIFDPFFTTKEVGEGTGLGLAVTYSLVQRMGGMINVISQLGTGTQFTVILQTGETKEEGHATDSFSRG